MILSTLPCLIVGGSIKEGGGANHGGYVNETTIHGKVVQQGKLRVSSNFLASNAAPHQRCWWHTDRIIHALLLGFGVNMAVNLVNRFY